MNTIANITKPYTFTPNPANMAKQVTPVQPGTPPKKQNFFDKILNVGTKVTDFANQAAGAVRNVQNVINPNAGTTPQPGTVFSYTPPGSQQQANTKQGMSTAAKVGIGLGVAAVVGTVVYFATKK